MSLKRKPGSLATVGHSGAWSLELGARLQELRTWALATRMGPHCRGRKRQTAWMTDPINWCLRPKTQRDPEEAPRQKKAPINPQLVSFVGVAAVSHCPSTTLPSMVWPSPQAPSRLPPAAIEPHHTGALVPEACSLSCFLLSGSQSRLALCFRFPLPQQKLLGAPVLPFWRCWSQSHCVRSPLPLCPSCPSPLRFSLILKPHHLPLVAFFFVI